MATELLLKISFIEVIRSTSGGNKEVLKIFFHNSLIFKKVNNGRLWRIGCCQSSLIRLVCCFSKMYCTSIDSTFILD